MSVEFNKIDPAALGGSKFDPFFLQWLDVLVNTLNQDLVSVEGAFNLLGASPYSQAQIVQMQADNQLTDSIFLYDTTNNVYVGRANGSLVKFTTAAYP